MDDLTTKIDNPDLSAQMIPTFLVHSTIPKKDPKDVLFSRKIDSERSLIQFSSPSGIIYGSLGRRVFSEIVTLAYLEKNPIISLGTASEFLSSINLKGSEISTGKNSYLARLRTQVDRITDTTLFLTKNLTRQSLQPSLFGNDQKKGTLEVKDGILIVKRTISNWDKKWNLLTMELTQDFINWCCSVSFPVSRKAYFKLRTSLSLDVYVFLCKQMFIMEKNNQSEQHLAWYNLQEVFFDSKNLQGSANFRNRFRSALEEIKDLVWPSLAYKFDTSFSGKPELVLKKSDLQIPTRKEDIINGL